MALLHPGGLPPAHHAHHVNIIVVILYREIKHLAMAIQHHGGMELNPPRSHERSVAHDFPPQRATH